MFERTIFGCYEKTDIPEITYSLLKFKAALMSSHNIYNSLTVNDISNIKSGQYYKEEGGLPYLLEEYFDEDEAVGGYE